MAWGPCQLDLLRIIAMLFQELAAKSCGQGPDLDVISEALDFGDEAFDLIWLGASVEVAGPEVLIENALAIMW